MDGERTRAISRTLRVGIALMILHAPQAGQATERPVPPPTAKAVEAMQLLTADDPYQRQVGFLRLEALRELGTVETIRPYVTHRDPEMRAYSLRALAAIEGVDAIPLLLERLRTEKQPRVRRSILLGLEPLQRLQPDLLTAFLDALRDRSPEVRMAAVDIVSRIDDPRARTAIRTRARKERDRDVRRVLAMAMRRLKR